MDVMLQNYLPKSEKNSSQDLKSYLPVWRLLWWSTAIKQQCDSSQTILEVLLTNVYKSTGILNPQFMWSYFKYREVPYNLRQDPVLFIPPASSPVDISHNLGKPWKNCSKCQICFLIPLGYCILPKNIWVSVRPEWFQNGKISYLENRW